MTESLDKATTLASLGLGKPTEYLETYSPHLLQAVPRSLNRDELNLGNDIPFFGTDRWNGYELSWLTSKGKPQVAILRCEVPANSPNLIESKSFKLYLNSFNQTKFDGLPAVQEAITKDLSACAGAEVKVEVLSLDLFSEIKITPFDGIKLDDLDITVNDYQHQATLLNCKKLPNNTLAADKNLQSNSEQSEDLSYVEESLYSDLLKSNCLITNQPDWGSVLIKYKGPQINHEGLLRYLISFRQHNEFHEQCVERIFCDIMQYCKPEKLSVYARYTRRGGLDINPFRSNFEQIYPEGRHARQ